jgi:hypothetical protein
MASKITLKIDCLNEKPLGVDCQPPLTIPGPITYSAMHGFSIDNLAWAAFFGNLRIISPIASQSCARDPRLPFE